VLPATLAGGEEVGVRRTDDPDDVHAAARSKRAKAKTLSALSGRR
jgi:hypothetical protein